jgi:SOS-response transcriptional repressor LexA
VRFIAYSITRHGAAPTLREIGAHFGITSTAVSDALRILERKRWITRRSHKARGLQLLYRPDGTRQVTGADGDVATAAAEIRRLKRRVAELKELIARGVVRASEVERLRKENSSCAGG